MSNTFGTIYRLTTFGESHGQAIGGIINGVPAGEPIDLDDIALQMSRRRPGQSAITTARAEADDVQLLSGIFEGRTTGTPIGFTIANTQQHSADYDNMRHTFRPSHADYTYTAKYGIRDHRGGGRSSARETAARVVGGSIAAQILSRRGISVAAYTSTVGNVSLPGAYCDYDLSRRYDNDVRCPDDTTAEAMRRLILDVKAEGDTVGGIITGVVSGLPAGIGEPVFGRLQAMLGAAMLSINAVKGFDYGMGFDGCTARGSDMIDPFIPDGHGGIAVASNHSGGIQGGISNGADIYFRVAFKPVATLLREVATVDYAGNPTTLHARGRHDPCVLPRAVPVVEAMAAMTILDAILLSQTTRMRP